MWVNSAGLGDAFLFESAFDDLFHCKIVWADSEQDENMPDRMRVKLRSYFTNSLTTSCHFEFFSRRFSGIYFTKKKTPVAKNVTSQASHFEFWLNISDLESLLLLKIAQWMIGTKLNTTWAMNTEDATQLVFLTYFMRIRPIEFLTKSPPHTIV